MIAPNTDIYLIKTPIEIDERNQLSFSNKNEQFNYFYNLPKLYLDNATYQRKDNVLRYPTDDITFDELLGYNYCMYRNTSYSDKWFYAFIKKIRYVNDGMSEIELETDVIQTWKFDIVYKESFVEREHVANDTYGYHTVPEGLETGEYIEYNSSQYTGFGANCVIMTSAIDLYTLSGAYVGWTQGTLTGGSYWKFGIKGQEHPTWQNQYQAVQDTFDYMAGKVDNITCLFMCPENLIKYSYNYPPRVGQPDNGWYEVNENRHTCFNTIGLSSNNITNLQDFTFNKPTKIGSYTPKNNKLLTFPYCYCMMSNNNGSNAIYHYEDFGYAYNSNQITFKVDGVVCPGCSIRAYPVNYKNASNTYVYGISAGKFPICSWSTDAYTNWLTQNSVNLGLQTGFDVLKIGTGAAMAASGNPMGAIMTLGGAADIGATLKEMYNKSFMPNSTQGDIGSGDIAFASGNNAFTIHQYRIKEEFAYIIDDYFQHFGYKVNSFKVPKIQTRKNWNYIKTRGLNIVGNIPQEDILKIKEIFDNGLTFWHNPNTFLDYSQNNYIV